MGDSDVMMAKTSAVDYKNANVTVACDTGISMAQEEEGMAGPGEMVSSAGNIIAADSVAHVSNVDTESVHDSSVAMQQSSSVMAYDAYENSSAPGNTSLDPTQVSGHDPSLNGNGVGDTGDGGMTNISENGATPADGIGSASAHQPLDSAGLSAEEERLWSIVTANSLDFGAWTALIDETERTSEGNILKIQKVYDTFLAEFPLCYGYWKKYADHVARLSSVDKVAEVYERAVQGVTYSVDMWLHYCVFAISTYGDPETIRRLFERALAYVGTDYLCFPLWDKYIEYEISQQDWPRVATIYTRILEIPNQQLDRYFEGFKELVANRPLSELRTADEVAAAVANSEVATHDNEGEAPPNMEQSTKAVNASLKDAEELENYIAIREEIYKKAKDVDSKIIGFETAIRRPYFHVRPLNVAELDNWHNYLDFIEGGGDFNKEGPSFVFEGPPCSASGVFLVVKLYERCLIACANYPEYWIRYVLGMEASGSMELAENALARATQIFVKRQPEIHLFAARFKEQHGDIPGARAAYQLVHTGISPGLLEAITKHANMEHRLGNLDDACSLYEQAIAIEKGKEQSQTLPLLFAQYSRFIYLVSGNVDKARQILIQGVESAQLSKPLLEAMIHLESIQPLPKQIEHLDSLVDKVVAPTSENPNVASIDEREELSSIFLEFLDLFGEAQTIKKASDRHSKLFLRRKSTGESRKRHAEDYLASDAGKQAKSLGSTNPHVMGAYPNTANQWAAGYNAQPQAWPQASQTQAQQWTPGYAQQAAYGAYNYGTGYVQPQAPTSIPQTAAAYGTYPPAYPTQQTYPQQAYAQPAAAPTLAPPQQPAPAAAGAPPAGYYNYY